jgi:hypothetical protein
MNSTQDHLDATLEHWNNIKDEYDWSGLLVGNGASLAVWEGFKYPSLYNKALQGIKNPLSHADQAVFTSINTFDFERVLSALWTTETVCKALGQENQAQMVQERYRCIQSALIEAVHAVHIPRLKLPNEILWNIRSALLSYTFVYSTNYDLLLYWAIMSRGTPSHKDYFWAGPESRSFDITNAEISDYARRILYLHGALHLLKLPYGSETRKLTSDEGDLLSQFGRSQNPGETPLFITEGTPQDKLTSIRSSDYLSFAYEEFINHRGNLVVFGHSLGESDAHLIDAMKHWKNCSIAISMRKSNNPNNIIKRKARIQEELPGAKILFFNAKTHPLGKSHLRIPRNGDNNQ